MPLKPLVDSLRDFIRGALALEAIPCDVYVPDQGPLAARRKRPAQRVGAQCGRAAAHVDEVASVAAA